jgi:hypothetical protein
MHGVVQLSPNLRGTPVSPRPEGMRAIRSIPNRSPSPTVRAAAAADNDPFQYADRMFGSSVHMVLVDDHGPAVSFMGWKLGAGRAESREVGGGSRTIEIEVLFAENGEYAVTERVATHLADTAPALHATVALFPSARDARRFAESATMDAMRDMALVAALDHSARAWPWLRRARKVTSYTIPFAL